MISAGADANRNKRSQKEHCAPGSSNRVASSMKKASQMCEEGNTTPDVADIVFIASVAWIAEAGHKCHK